MSNDPSIYSKSNFTHNPDDNLDSFIKLKPQFQLGELPTEQPHPLTKNLSQLCKSDIDQAIELLKEADQMALNQLNTMADSLLPLFSAIQNTLKHKNKIYLVGCGATGRLSLALETLWRQSCIDSSLNDSVVSFMAGGDVALIHSIEKFEDYPNYGARQLRELDFKDGDLLIATTEGGETPFVIGATEEATKISSNTPFFLYCNPDRILCKVAERSKNIINNSKIHKINLFVGPMALTGSTRMQASTVLMLSVGACLLNYKSTFKKASEQIFDLINLHKKLDLKPLKSFILNESESYKNNELVIYQTDAQLGISILTDTTERAPTFSLRPFENQTDSIKNPSLCYICIRNDINSKNAWQNLLHRKPRTFHWPEVTDKTTYERLLGFDFSANLIEVRKNYITQKQKDFFIEYNHGLLRFIFENDEWDLNIGHHNLLTVHIILKLILNTHSTILMGRLDRFQNNLMTWVKPSNYKLIDRTVRYAQQLLKDKNIEKDYDSLVKDCFELKGHIQADESLVLSIVNKNSRP